MQPNEKPNPSYSRKPLSEAGERLRYQLRHFDLMDQLGAAWSLIVRYGLCVGPTDVSPELAAHIQREIKGAPMHDKGETASHWSEA